MLTRIQLSRHYNVSVSKIRRILKALSIEPCQKGITKRGLPIFYYDQSTINVINAYIEALTRKHLQNLKRCCICKKKFPQKLMLGTRCPDCYVKKACMPIIYGKQFWNKHIKTQLISKAVDYLSRLISNPK